MKIAYPNNNSSIFIQNSYDRNKWVLAMKDIYSRVSFGVPNKKAFQQVTEDWSAVEKKDFENWMRFYQDNAQSKYKMAQMNYYVNDGMPGYFVPNPAVKNNDKPASIIPGSPEFNKLDVAISDADKKRQAKEKKDLIEKQRQKLISRLYAAAKILRSETGHEMVGAEHQRLVKSLYDLITEFETINKVSLSSDMYVNLIIRQANILQKEGLNKSATFLKKFAQVGASPPFSADLALTPDFKGGDMTAGPAIDLNQTPPEKTQDSGIDKFLKKLNNEEDEIMDSSLADDDLIDVVEDTIVLDDLDDDFESELIVRAQAIDAPIAEIKEVSNAPIPAASNVVIDKDFDKLIDSAFASLKITDVIKKLEEVNHIFKTREIPRQLAIADVMLDRLGLASFFPSLAEATNKSLESNQYCLTRIEDILGKLRGSLKVKQLDLTNENQSKSQDPLIGVIKENLEQDADKEKARKELRKNIEQSAIDEKTKQPPVVESPAEELKQAPSVTTPQPAEIAPQAPTPVAPK